MDWLHSLNPTIQDVLSAFGRAILAIIPIFAPVPFIIWYERRLLSWMQDRIGPNRTGNITFSRTSKVVPGFLRGKKFKLFGLAQSMADGLKLFLKEDIMPDKTDRFLFILAPLIALFVALTLGCTIPFGGDTRFTPVADVNIGLLYILAISSLGAYSTVLAGYSSNNKYSLLGGLRASAQLISYELAMGVSLAAMVMTTGSLKMTDVVNAQAQPLYGEISFLHNWNILTPMGFISAVVFFICMLAETNRPPFDLPEAENELVAGYHTEYSTKRWGLFMMAEYMAMFTFSMVFATVFLGGYQLPIRWDALAPLENSYLMGLAVMMFKGAVGLSVYIWVRATFPRLRYDQLMNLGWRFLLPLAVANLMITATWIFATKVYSPTAGWITGVALYAILFFVWAMVRHRAKKLEPQYRSRSVNMVSSNRRTVEVVSNKEATS
ncbi:MAG: NADH-quinone oxidoreductase subunit H [Armatimonadetes bacterium]|nr:NADH-quinone oxidoreductase subunit H [Armatimonadota bacterium]